MKTAEKRTLTLSVSTMCTLVLLVLTMMNDGLINFQQMRQYSPGLKPSMSYISCEKRSRPVKKGPLKFGEKSNGAHALINMADGKTCKPGIRISPLKCGIHICQHTMIYQTIKMSSMVWNFSRMELWKSKI